MHITKSCNDPNCGEASMTHDYDPKKAYEQLISGPVEPSKLEARTHELMRVDRALADRIRAIEVSREGSNKRHEGHARDESVSLRVPPIDSTACETGVPDALWANGPTR